MWTNRNASDYTKQLQQRMQFAAKVAAQTEKEYNQTLIYNLTSGSGAANEESSRIPYVQAPTIVTAAELQEIQCTSTTHN